MRLPQLGLHSEFQALLDYSLRCSFERAPRKEVAGEIAYFVKWLLSKHGRLKTHIYARHEGMCLPLQS